MIRKITNTFYQIEKTDTRLRYSIGVSEDVEEKDFEPNKKGYSKILKELRDSLRLLTCYKLNEKDVKNKRIDNKYKDYNYNGKETNGEKSNKYFDNYDIYLCIKRIVEDSIKNGLNKDAMIENVNKYIYLLNSKELIDNHYYGYIVAMEHFLRDHCYHYDVEDAAFNFLILIEECKEDYKQKIKKRK